MDYGENVVVESQGTGHVPRGGEEISNFSIIYFLPTANILPTRFPRTNPSYDTSLERSVSRKIDMNSLDICIIGKSIFSIPISKSSREDKYPSSRPIPDCLNPPNGI